jgi:sugar/nucleoside kinase (ribokinase family)
VLSGGDGRHHPTAPAAAVDTTGAGDAFNAAFLASHRRGGDLAEAARFANAVAGWVVARFGARPPIDDALRAILAG